MRKTYLYFIDRHKITNVHLRYDDRRGNKRGNRNSLRIFRGSTIDDDLVWIAENVEKTNFEKHF
jgi:hypothetical protein